MGKERPIRIFWQKGVSWMQIFFVIRIIYILLKLLGANKKIAIQIGKVFDLISYREESTRSKFFNQYDAGKLIDDFSVKQLLDNYGNYYTVFLMRDEIFLNTSEGIKPILGLAKKEEAAIVNVGYEFLFGLNYKRRFRAYCIAIHELGHLFGLPSPDRKDEIALSPVNQARHCANNCIMYHTLEESIRNNFFCQTCLKELQEFFK